MSPDCFKDVPLGVNDLYLLESFQIGYLPGWIPEPELAAVLWAYPSIKHFFVEKCPPVTEFIERIMSRFPAADNPETIDVCADKIVRKISDLLGYNKCPEEYDCLAFHKWDFQEITSITSLENKIVLDGGSGTGRVALEAAQTAKHVFAMEPVTRLRQFIREKALAKGLKNVFVMDGFLHAIPLPDDFVDVLITSHALGWRLEDELREFERVVKSGGMVIHCPGTADRDSDNDVHSHLVSSDWQYKCSRYKEADGWKRKYWKQV